jgi:hypothetical protein
MTSTGSNVAGNPPKSDPRLSRRPRRPRHAGGAGYRALHSRLRIRPETQSRVGLLASQVRRSKAGWRSGPGRARASSVSAPIPTRPGLSRRARCRRAATAATCTRASPWRARIGGGSSSCVGTCCGRPSPQDRLTLRPDGTVVVLLRTPWRDGHHPPVLRAAHSARAVGLADAAAAHQRAALTRHPGAHVRPGTGAVELRRRAARSGQERARGRAGRRSRVRGRLAR